MKRKIIPKSVKGIKVYKYIPFDKKKEIGGYIKEGILYYEKGDEHSCWHLPENDCVFEFHTRPSDDAAMPSITNLLKSLLSTNKITIILARKELIVITKTKKTKDIGDTLVTTNRCVLLQAATNNQSKGGERNYRKLLKALSKWIDELCKAKLIKKPDRMVLFWQVDWEYVYRDLLHFRIKHYKR